MHMVARLTEISNSFSRYFRIAQEGSSVSGITSLYIGVPIANSVQTLRLQLQLLGVLYLSFGLPFAGLIKHVMKMGT